MAAFSDYYENKIIDHMLRGAEFTPPANIYLALFTANTNLEINAPTAEVSGGGYAREEVTLNAASGGASENNTNITFNTATANWGTVTSWALTDSAGGTVWGTNVNVLMWGQVNTAKTVDNGDTAKVNSGELDVSVD